MTGRDGPGLNRRGFLGATAATAAGLGVAGGRIASGVAAEAPGAVNTPGNAADTSGDADGVPDGMLGGEFDGGANRVFVDVARVAERFGHPGDGEATFDDAGEPTSDLSIVYDWRPTAEWEGPGGIDNPTRYAGDYSGVWKVTFTGQAESVACESESTSAEIRRHEYDEESNTTEVDLEVGFEQELLVFSFEGTRRTPDAPTGSGFTDLSIVQPGYERGTDQEFREDVLDTYRPFDPIRFMGAMKTNDVAPFDAEGPVLTGWSDRKDPDTPYRAWASTPDGRDGGLPWETFADLANAIGNDVWIDLKVSCTDGYLRNLAELLADRLAEDTTIYLEWGNEVWNFGFQTFAHLDAWAEDLASSDPSLDGPNDLDYDGTTAAPNLRTRLKAQRTVRAAEIFADVFGTGEVPDGRVRPVLQWEHGAFGIEEERDALGYVADNHGDPGEFFHSLAVRDGFGPENPREGGTVEELLDSAAESATDKSYVAERREMLSAEGYDLGITAYEAGPGMGIGEGNETNRILAAYSRRMGDLIERSYEAWFEAGGGVTCQFTVSSSPGDWDRYGTWGATDDVLEPFRAHKWGRCVQINGGTYGGTANLLHEYDVEFSVNHAGDGATSDDTAGDGEFLPFEWEAPNADLGISEDAASHRYALEITNRGGPEAVRQHVGVELDVAGPGAFEVGGSVKRAGDTDPTDVEFVVAVDDGSGPVETATEPVEVGEEYVRHVETLSLEWDDTARLHVEDATFFVRTATDGGEAPDLLVDDLRLAPEADGAVETPTGTRAGTTTGETTPTATTDAGAGIATEGPVPSSTGTGTGTNESPGGTGPNRSASETATATDGQPGFGVVAGLVAVAGGALAAVRRARRED